jgi:hypothetical protein
MTYTAKELERLGRAIAPPVVELRRWRRAHFLTVPELAAILGINAQYLGQVELGWRAMPRSWPRRIAALYKRWSDVRLPAASVVRAERRAKDRPSKAKAG